MKTTNYKISKKLAEIGFERKFPPAFYHVNPNQTLYYRTPQKDYSDKKGIFNIKSYDLETILEALPKRIDDLHFWATYSDSYIFGYVDGIIRNTKFELKNKIN